MIDIDNLFRSSPIESVNQFFLGTSQNKRTLTDHDIVSVMFVCRMLNNITSFEQVCAWAGENRQSLIKKISRGVVILDMTLDGSDIDLAFRFRNLNMVERAFTLASSVEEKNSKLFNAILGVNEKSKKLKLLEFMVRLVYFKLENHTLLKVNKTALLSFVESIDFLQKEMSKHKFQSLPLQKIKSAALIDLGEFSAARISLSNLTDPEVSYQRLQIEFREACAAGEFKEAQRVGISMIEDLLNRPFLKKGFKKRAKFDSDACLVALRRTYEVLDVNGINPFLISGTLLGMVREGKIFDHDKDFDLGVIGWEKQFEVFEVLYKSEEFNVDIRGVQGQKTYILSARHKSTGIAFDVFFLHPAEEKFIYGINFKLGFTLKFRFNEFSLVKRKFGSDVFRIPAQPARFLSEKYGDGWSQKDPTYDVVLRSPAIIDRGSELYKTLALDRILGSIAKDNTDLAKINIRFLRELDMPCNDEFTRFIKALSV